MNLSCFASSDWQGTLQFFAKMATVYKEKRTHCLTLISWGSQAHGRGELLKNKCKCLALRT